MNTLSAPAARRSRSWAVQARLSGPSCWSARIRSALPLSRPAMSHYGLGYIGRCVRLCKPDSCETLSGRECVLLDCPIGPCPSRTPISLVVLSPQWMSRSRAPIIGPCPQPLQTRKTIAASIRRKVLTEARYRCAVPTCRTILAIDLHHLVRVADGGEGRGRQPTGTCPNCHARGLGRWRSPRFAGLIVAGLVRISPGNVAASGAFDGLLIGQPFREGKEPVGVHGNQEALEAANVGASSSKLAPEQGPIQRNEGAGVDQNDLVIYGKGPCCYYLAFRGLRRDRRE